MLGTKPFLAVFTACLLFVTFLFLFGAQALIYSTSTTAIAASAPQTTEPLALVKSVLVGSTERPDAPITDLRVTRVSGAQEAVRPDMRLYAGDEIQTGANAQVTILFLDDVTEKDNEVHVDANSRVQIGSVFTWLGRVFIRCRGAFDTKTEKVRLGVRGTEFEVVVSPDGTNKITVLDGSVSIEKNDTTSLERTDTREWAFGKIEPQFLNFVKASYVPEPPPQERLELVALTGKTTTIQNEFRFNNRCKNRHQYEISGPRNLNWFHLLSAESFTVEGGQSRVITFVIRIDAQGVAPQNYQGEIVARCIDCQYESGCDLAGLLLPVSVTIVGSGSGGTGSPSSSPVRSPSSSATSSPTPSSQQRAVANRQQEVIVNNSGVLPPAPASEQSLRSSINWSSSVIIASQPSYVAQSVIPHFVTWSVRDQQFREARLKALLENDRKAYEVLGDVYTDWGSGAKAVEAYGKASVPTGSLGADLLSDFGEALRLAGRLDEAEAKLKQALIIDARWAPALNTMGNIQRDRATIARERGDFQQAQSYLDLARENYEAAVQAAPSTPIIRHHVQAGSTVSQKRPDAIRAVAKANVGEALLDSGELARKRGQSQDAMNNYANAERAFREAIQIDRSYVFARTGLGDLYWAAGETAKEARSSNADQFFGRSQEQYVEALTLSGDMAEAQVGLGNVSLSTGKRDEAIKRYLRAAQLRPEQSEQHYRLATTLAPINPALAAEYAATYMKLERKIFRIGERWRTAESIKRGQPPVTPTTPTPVITPSPYDHASPSPSGPLVKVPGLKGDKPDSALKELRKLGLEGQLRDQADCEASGKVLYSNPDKDARVPQGSTVTVFVSSAGENPTSVPRVTGMHITQAEQELRNVQLSLKVDRKEETDKAAPDTVTKQKPDAYKQIKRNCPVEVTIAIPIPPVTVRDYRGMSLREAEQAIVFGRLSLGRIEERESRYAEETVIDQLPHPGEVVPRGSRINLVVSRSITVTVPDVYGMGAQAAVNTLRLAGFRAQIVQGDTRYGRVTRQSPPGGSPARRGSVVQLWLSSEGDGGTSDGPRGGDRPTPPPPYQEPTPKPPSRGPGVILRRPVPTPTPTPRPIP